MVMADLIKFLIALAVVVLLLWIFRGVILWFFNLDRLTEIRDLQAEQNEILREICDKLNK
jgi:hypothetical protein